MIIFLYGEDSFRSRQKLKELKEKFLREVDPSGHSLITLDGETVTMEKINEAVGASSLFARKRMIIIERLFLNKSQTVFDLILNYLKSNFAGDGKKVGEGAKEPRERKGTKKENNILVFWDEVGEEKVKKNKIGRFLVDQPYAYCFKPLSNTQAVSWVKRAVARQGATIQHQAAINLVSLFGSDLWALNNEIKKLISYKRGQTTGNGSQQANVVVNREDVMAMSVGSLFSNIFALLDAISHQQKGLALSLLEKELAAGTAENYLLYMLVRQFKILLQVRECLNQGQTARVIASRLKLHPFVVQKSLLPARRFSVAVLKKLYQELLDVDKQAKIGQINIKTALSRLLVEI